MMLNVFYVLYMILWVFPSGFYTVVFNIQRKLYPSEIVCYLLFVVVVGLALREVGIVAAVLAVWVFPYLVSVGFILYAIWLIFRSKPLTDD